MSVKVCKFGGTSTADAGTIKKVKRIIESDDARRFIVVSAPGKRYSGDTKITDMLLACHRELLNVGNCRKSFAAVRSRFSDIIRQLKLSIDFADILDATLDRIEKEKSEQFTASRGEYLCAIILAKYLGMKFIDAEDVIYFNENGSLNADKTYRAVASAVNKAGKAVIPGFYGVDEVGRIRTFSRGGSDISGAIVARAVNATLYENWTDVSGFFACDPNIVDSPALIETLSYRELRELSYMGASVLHGECVFHVCRANIPIQIKNVFRPVDKGTIVVPASANISDSAVAGIAGKKNFTVIYIEKSLMNSEIGFARKVLSVVESENVPVEHIPTGVDTLSLFIESKHLSETKLSKILEGIKYELGPDIIKVIENVALIAVVGHGITSPIGSNARLFNALGAAEISVKMIDMGSSEHNIIIGVKNEDYERCIKAVYSEFFVS